MDKDEISQDNVGKIQDRSIETEMQQSYLDYAMSVIVSRALPDVRDGLKPVHRRILYAMHRNHWVGGTKHIKSAKVVGEVLGKYHPHGDLAVYDAMVRLAQPWNMRYLLIDGQGNFGSVDGDGAAAHRYTEARLAKISDEVLADIEKETVDFVPNFDSTSQEPVVLPTKVPQILMNGTVGIAVGMATNIPPHNLGELLDAIVHLIGHKDASIDDLMEYVQGPDFPTGGIIFNIKDIKEAYTTGHGPIVMRAVAEIVERKGNHQIIVTELPYQVNKATLVEKIADLVKAKKITGIADLRDESDRQGIRVAIDLKKDAYPRKVLNQLFKMTQMQSTFHVNLLALVDGLQPRVLDLKSVLQHFIDYRRKVVTRRTQYNLKKAEERAHILEGFKIALENIDAVIKTIKKSATKEEAHKNLRKKFKLTDIQTTAILEMRLSALAGLERKKVEDEYKEKKQLIKELKELLKDPKKIDGTIKTECKEIKEKYGDERRTKVSSRTVGELTDLDLVPNEEVVVTMTVGGYVKRQPIGDYRTQRRGGSGVIGMTTKEEDQINSIQVAKNHDDILFFTNRGRVFKQKVFEIPKASRIARGTSVVNLIQTAPDELVTAISALSEFDDKDDFVMMTKQGVVKKTSVSAYANIRTSGLIAIKLDEGDELKWVRRSRPGDEIMIATRDGQSIRFRESDARSLGRSTRGVRGIRLRKGDEVIGGVVAKQGKTMALLVVSEKGLGKQTLLSRYSMQKRGGIGLKTMKVTSKTGKLVGGALVDRDVSADIIITSIGGQIIRLPLKGISTLGRATQGVRVMRLKGGDKVASFTVLVMEDVDGSLSDPNEELASEQVSRLAGKKKAAPKFAKRKLVKPAGRSIEARLASKRVSPSAGSGQSGLAGKKKGFIKKKLSGPKGSLRDKPTPKLKAKLAGKPLDKLGTERVSRLAGKKKTAPTKKKGFTVRKLMSKLAGKRVSPSAGSGQSRLAGKKKTSRSAGKRVSGSVKKSKQGFTKRKLR